jgi:hypothetical protein
MRQRNFPRRTRSSIGVSSERLESQYFTGWSFERQREQVVGGEQVADILRELAGRVDLGGPQGDPAHREIPDQVTQIKLLLGQAVLDRIVALGQRTLVDGALYETYS